MTMFLNESIIAFGALTRRITPCRNNRPVAVSTIHRWRSPGLRGIRLEAIRIGGVWCTSIEAFDRFILQTTNADRSPTRSVRQSSSLTTDALDAAGI